MLHFNGAVGRKQQTSAQPAGHLRQVPENCPDEVPVCSQLTETAPVSGMTKEGHLRTVNVHPSEVRQSKDLEHYVSCGYLHERQHLYVMLQPT